MQQTLEKQIFTDHFLCEWQKSSTHSFLAHLLLYSKIFRKWFISSQLWLAFVVVLYYLANSIVDVASEFILPTFLPAWQLTSGITITAWQKTTPEQSLLGRKLPQHPLFLVLCASYPLDFKIQCFEEEQALGLGRGEWRLIFYPRCTASIRPKRPPGFWVTKAKSLIT